MNGFGQGRMGENRGVNIFIRQFRLKAHAERGNQFRSFRPHNVRPQQFAVSAPYKVFTKPSGSPAATALPMAWKGNFPTLYSTPASLRARSVLPTEATCG